MKIINVIEILMLYFLINFSKIIKKHKELISCQGTLQKEDIFSH